MTIARWAAWFICIIVFVVVLTSDSSLTTGQQEILGPFFAIGVGILIVAYPLARVSKGCGGLLMTLFCIAVLVGFFVMGITLTMD